MSDKKATQVGGDQEPSRERKTQIMYTPTPSAAPSLDSLRLESNRKIVGVMISYSWRPQGQLFAIYEARTHIGSGQLSDNPNQDCEVCCPQDNQLSADHALILVRKGKAFIEDLASTNGTVVNGKELNPREMVDLPSSAEIKVGQTTLTFLKFDVSAAAEKPNVPVPKKKGSGTDLKDVDDVARG